MASKWDVYRGYKPPVKKEPAKRSPISRVVPPLIARNPDLMDLIVSHCHFKGKNLSANLRRAYRRIGEWLKEKFDSQSSN